MNNIYPRVSIIIPAFNAERFINETLDSVVNQTYPNIEAFVIDDGSRDRTLEMAHNFESEKLKVLTQKNQGACVARNKGLSMSSGKYVQYLDADDVLSYDKIEEQVKILEQNEGFLAICASVHFMDGEDYKSMQPREEKFWIHNTDNPVDFLIRLYGGDGERWMVQTSAWLTPKAICDKIGPWDETLLLDQDGEYFARVVLASKGIRTTGGINYYRRFFYGGNISAKAYKKENLQSALHALNCKAKYLDAYDQSDRLKQALATLYLEIAINAYPVHKDLTAICEQKVKETGKKAVVPVLGGRAIETVKKVLGWRAAKKLSYLVHKKKK